MRFMFHLLVEMPEDARFNAVTLVFWFNPHDHDPGAGHRFTVPEPEELQFVEKMQFPVQVFQDLVHIGELDKEGNGFILVIYKPYHFRIHDRSRFFE